MVQVPRWLPKSPAWILLPARLSLQQTQLTLLLILRRPQQMQLLILQILQRLRPILP
nr:MAG TPA: hypothetical protein [Caudoviricetes sp.]